MEDLKLPGGFVTHFFVMLSTLMALSFCSSDTLAWEGPAQSPGASLSSFFHPATYVAGTLSGTTGETAIQDSHFRGNIVAVNNKKDTLQIIARQKRLQVGQEMGLAGTDQKIPGQLWSMDLGPSYSHRLEGGDSVGFMSSVGSASNIPFHSYREVSLQATGTYLLHTDALHSWVFLLSYNNNGSFAPGIPFPFAAYVSVNPANHTVICYGIPSFIAWKPSEDWSLKMLYILPVTTQAEITYQFLKPFKAHLGFDYAPQIWFRADREDVRRRLFFDQKKASLGVKAVFNDRLYFDLTGSHAYGRRIYESRRYLDRKTPKTNLAPSFQVESELAYRF